MPTIFDKNEIRLEERLNRKFQKSAQSNFCIEYFSLKAWQKVATVNDKLPNGQLPEES